MTDERLTRKTIANAFGFTEEELPFDLFDAQKRRREAETADFLERLGAWKKLFEDRINELLRSGE